MDQKDNKLLLYRHNYNRIIGSISIDGKFIPDGVLKDMIIVPDITVLERTGGKITKCKIDSLSIIPGCLYKSLKDIDE